MPDSSTVMTPAQLLDHWVGHRRLTRRVIDAYPADQFETFSIGGMRPFSQLVQELLKIAGPMLTGFVERRWEAPAWEPTPLSKGDALAAWDAETAKVEVLMPKIGDAQWQAMDKAFGQFDGTTCSLVFYAIDNEIHHRAQGYVYLRALGVEPPAFYDRS